MVHFWASWSEPSKQVSEAIVDLSDEYKDCKFVEVITQYSLCIVSKYFLNKLFTMSSLTTMMYFCTLPSFAAYEYLL